MATAWRRPRPPCRPHCRSPRFCTSFKISEAREGDPKSSLCWGKLPACLTNSPPCSFARHLTQASIVNTHVTKTSAVDVSSMCSLLPAMRCTAIRAAHSPLPARHPRLASPRHASHDMPFTSCLPGPPPPHPPTHPTHLIPTPHTTTPPHPIPRLQEAGLSKLEALLGAIQAVGGWWDCALQLTISYSA